MSLTKPSPTANRLLAALPAKNLEHLLASCESIEARLARWLLMTRDRARSDEFYLTQDFLSHMLGVRRVGVTNAAGSLQKRKLVSYSRGAITILDPSGLEAAACGCYRADKKTYDRILG